MQACQFCGAKSWGPANLQSAEQTPPSVVSDHPHLFRKCDHCHSYALLSIIDESTPGNDFVPGLGSFPGSHTVTPRFMGILPPPPPPFDPIAGAMEALKGIGVGPKPYQSRTFDLVRDLIAANPLQEGQSNEGYTKWLILTALLIEDELDRAAKLDQESAPVFEMKPCNFKLDFAAPAMYGLSEYLQLRVGIGLDCAIVYGALEAQTGNESLKLSPQLEQAYWEKVARLKASTS